MKRRTAVLSALVAFPLLAIAYFGHDPSSVQANSGRSTVPIDEELMNIASHPQSYRFVDQVTDRVDRSKMIKIHSIAPQRSNDKYIALRPGSIRYFRADGASSADGEKASINWSVDGVSHTTELARPGDIIMVVRSLDGVVTWYSLQIDMRC
ncbi:MAG: hypothetical protein AAGI63_17280 [Planctomycetota bacterium]